MQTERAEGSAIILARQAPNQLIQQFGERIGWGGNPVFPYNGGLAIKWLEGSFIYFMQSEERVTRVGYLPLDASHMIDLSYTAIVHDPSKLVFVHPSHRPGLSVGAIDSVRTTTFEKDRMSNEVVGKGRFPDIDKSIFEAFVLASQAKANLLGR